MKKRFLSFILTLTMMVSLLLVCPLVAHADGYTVNLAMPKDYPGKLSYIQLIQNAASTAVNTENKITNATTTVNTGNKITKASRMTDSGKDITIDGTVYRIYSATTSILPTKETTSIKVSLDVATCPAPTLTTASAVSIPVRPLVTDAVTTQWYSDSDWQYGENIVAVLIDSANISLSGYKGKIRFVDITEYTVTFNSNGGTGSMETQTFTGSTAQKLTRNAFVYEGYTFKGWSEDSSAVSATFTDEQEISVSKSMTLYAVWEPIVLQEITVTASSANKTYDGTALTCNNYSITSGTLISGDALSVTFTGTITNAGYTANVIDSIKVMRGQEDVSSEYDIECIEGVLTVDKADITLTSGSDVKAYDGTPLTNSNVAVSGAVASGESFSFIVTGSQTEVGSSDNSFSYGAGAMTDLNNYNITTVYGTLTVTEPAPSTGDSIAAVAAVTVAAIGIALSFRRKKEND